jgi:ATP-binding cassette subfamily B protein
MVRYRPWLYALVALNWILYHLWPLLPGLLAKAFFDTITGVSSALQLWQIVALALLLGLGKSGVLLSVALSGPRWTMLMAGLIHRNIIARILMRPGAAPLPDSIGAAISTMRDDTDMMRLSLDLWFDGLAGLLLAGAGMAILFIVDARVTVLVFAPIVLVILLASAARTRLEHAREHSRAATAAVTGAIGEIFGAVQAIQVAAAEERVVAHLRRLGQRRRDLVLRDRLQSLAIDAIFAMTASLGAGLTLIVAAEQIRSGAFSIGDFALFAAYLLQVADYTGFLGYLLRTYRQVGVSFQRGVALLQGAPPAALVEHHPLYLGRGERLPGLPATVRAPGDTLRRLEVRGLTLRHPGGAGVEDVSFELAPGRLTVITGRVGSGKTTLVRALLGLLPADRGEVLWNGSLVADLARWMVPPRVAYTAQVPGLLSGTLRENLLLGAPADPPAIEAALWGAAFDRDLADWPSGLETVVGARGVRLSGGQAQRLAAARMLLHRAELLVIDDLSSALDVETERELWSRLGQGSGIRGRGSDPRASRPLTILAVSHRPSLLERADEIIVLDQGRVAARGRYAELLEHSPAFRKLLAGDRR